MTIRRSGPNMVDVNNERLTFEDEMTASDFIACLSHGDVESCSQEFPPEQTEYIGDEIGDPCDGSDANPAQAPSKTNGPHKEKSPRRKDRATKKKDS